MPTFTVTNLVNGKPADYKDIWQRNNLVLVLLANDGVPTSYIESLAQTIGDAARDTAFVVTSGSIPGVPIPAVVIADRWGEICFLHSAANIGELPNSTEIADCLDYVRVQCPECQGETR